MEMQKITKSTKPRYLTDDKGDKKAIVLSLKEYEKLLDALEDFQDAITLMKAEREATSFRPYEEFRKTWLRN